jgi:hypothetical protein
LGFSLRDFAVHSDGASPADVSFEKIKLASACISEAKCSKLCWPHPVAEKFEMGSIINQYFYIYIMIMN